MDMSVKYMHLRGMTSRGGVTIAYETISYRNTITFAVARCSKDDNFNKSVGREIALDRLRSGQSSGVTISEVVRRFSKETGLFNKKFWEETLLKRLNVDDLAYTAVEFLLSEMVRETYGAK
jgi:hypothetical protein